MPELSPPAFAFFRTAYGVLLLGMLLMTLPHARRFFVSERWGGYGQSTPDVDAIQNPVVHPLVMVAWFGSAILLTVGWWTFWAALTNLILCRYFFVRMRWKSVARGMGAPGFMTYWSGAALFLLVVTRNGPPSLHQLALLVLQVDFAFIMLSAGLYKVLAGYLSNHGMEFGLANPQWGYWWRWYAGLAPGHWLFRTLNHLAWSTEIVAGLLMLIPPTRALGAALIIASFFFIATQIRLGFLCEMVMLAGVLYFPPGSLGDRLVGHLAPDAAALALPSAVASPVVEAALTVGLLGYLVLLPLAHAGLFYNFCARKRLPGWWQRALDAYTNFFGIIIWRVFSVDVVNFLVLIHHRPQAGGERTIISRYGWVGGLRYGHVGESIAVTSVFTTLKYYPSNAALFRERLLRYARTVPCPPGSVLVFEYVSIGKAERGFEHVPVAEFVVDVTAGTVTERVLNAAVSVRAAHAVSPVHEGLRPGTYAPMES